MNINFVFWSKIFLSSSRVNINNQPPLSMPGGFRQDAIKKSDPRVIFRAIFFNINESAIGRVISYKDGNQQPHRTYYNYACGYFGVFMGHPNRERKRAQSSSAPSHPYFSLLLSSVLLSKCWLISFNSYSRFIRIIFLIFHYTMQ